jgi:hypothetical protein
MLILLLRSKFPLRYLFHSLLTSPRARRRHYAASNIGWCARPPHEKDGFVRKGRFKKASNMNYCLDFSNRVEDELSRLISQLAESRNTETRNITIKEENLLYQQAFDSTVSSDEGRTMAAGDVRLGEILLLIDCDTRVVSLAILLFLTLS